MSEVWKDIDEYKGLYQVSNWGRIKSVERILKDGRSWKEKILKTSKNNRGYLTVGLWKNGKCKSYLVHRLVAEAFLNNPDNLPIINHKDQNPSNNNVDNLEWCNQKYNVNYGTAIQRKAEKQINGKLSKTVYQYTLDGELIAEYPSTNEVERQLGYKQPSISYCCNGQRKTAYGYKWTYFPNILL